MVIRALGYTRASLDSTGEGLAVDRQARAIRALAESREWTLVGIEEDNSISAYGKKKRPGWERVLHAIETDQVDVVVAWALDRLTRSMKDLERIIDLAEKHNVAIATATGDIDLTTDTGRMIARILAAVARAEVERKAERQRAAWEQRAGQGRPTPGFRPFGYEHDQMTVRESEAELIRQAMKDVLAGVSTGAIARHWNDLGIRSARHEYLRKEDAKERDAEWTATSVRWVLSNPRISGRRKYNGSIVGDAQWPAIVTVDEQEAYLSIVRSRRMPNKPGPKPIYLLSGIVRCGKCGSHVTYRARSNRSTDIYRCQGKGCTLIKRPDLDAYVSTLVVEFLSDPDSADLLHTGEKNAEVDELRAKKAFLEERLNGLAVDYAEGLLTREQMVAGTARARESLEAVEARLSTFAGGHALDGLAGAPNAAQMWEGLDLERKRAVIRWLLDIELKPGVQGIERVQWAWKHEKAGTASPDAA
ncbi:recombinase family protein [Puerhibacterium puerhi]|uniref:recombinase family protein n=1 Tax=Puerhibacterium puerhi TaxID=2692623 RepID=UPI00135AF9B5|nr:recombinase family protein [Puerhibacterium puerhi]